MINQIGLTRREFLSTASAAAIVLSGRSNADVFLVDGDYGPFRMGMQSYTLRAFSFDRAIELTQKFGLHYWESYQAHIGLTEDHDKLSSIADKLTSNKILLMGWGVQAFDSDAAKSRKIFEFAKKLKIKTITADPNPESFDSLEKLCEEFKISIAIHNHGPGARYDKIRASRPLLRGEVAELEHVSTQDTF